MNVRTPPPPYRLLDVGQSDEGELFLEVQVELHRSRERRLISMRDLQDAPDKAMSRLGLPLLTRPTKTHFLRNAEAAFGTKTPTFRVAAKPGWRRSVFVLPEGTRGAREPTT